MPKNVIGTDLKSCCMNPITGYHRNGFCETGPEDLGLHIVCIEITDTFLAFSAARGNDLSTPLPEYHFPGLKPGDKWCLCALRWKEAYLADAAPRVCLEGTHVLCLEFLDMEWLQAHALP